MKLARFRHGTAAPTVAIEDSGKWRALPTEMDWLSILQHVMEGTALSLLPESDKGRSAFTEDLTSAAPIADSAAPIWGAGLNYRGHSDDLQTSQPTSGPGSYVRPSNSLIGNGEEIVLPEQSARVTAEAELGLVIGRRAKNVRAQDWRSVVVGLTAVLDMTAEDAIRLNPRHIPWAKGFDTFCSVGPQLVTVDDVSDDALETIEVSTVLNGVVESSATPAAMKYGIGELVEYFSAGRTLPPGTVICTGTPGAAVITPGDRVEAIVAGVGHLSHLVR